MFDCGGAVWKSRLLSAKIGGKIAKIGNNQENQACAKVQILVDFISLKISWLQADDHRMLSLGCGRCRGFLEKPAHCTLCNLIPC